MADYSAEALIARFQALRGRSENFRSLWQEVANYVIPRKGRITSERAAGAKQTQQIYDTTAVHGLGTFAAGLLSHLTPQGEIWARLVSSEREPSEALKRWFDEESLALMDELHESNFYSAVHEAFISLGAFGTAAVFLEEGRQSYRYNFSEVAAGSFVIAENNEGVVDTVFREWKWTARQAAQQWGKDRLGKRLREALEADNKGQGEREFTFLHCVFPREAQAVRRGELVEARLRPYASLYVCMEDKLILEEGGYYEMPYAVCRLLASSGEVYGRGPGTEALPDIKVLNRIVYDTLLAAELELNKSWLAAEDSGIRIDNRPGGVTTWDSTNPANKPEQLRTDSRIDISGAMRSDITLKIEQAFFVDMFQMLNRPDVANKQKTATEVNAMLQEKMPTFSTIFVQVTRELLSPLIQRAFRIRLRGGRASEPPADLVDGGELGYKVSFAGRIAQEIKATQDAGTMQVINLAAQMGQLEPTVIHVVKWRERFRAMARNWGLPMEDLRTEEEVAEILEAQAEQQAGAQAAEQIQAMTGAVKNMGPLAQEASMEAMGGL